MPREGFRAELVALSVRLAAIHAAHRAVALESADLIRLSAAKYQRPFAVNGIPDGEPAERSSKCSFAKSPTSKRSTRTTGKDLLASGEIDIVLEYNGDMAQLLMSSPKAARQFDFVVPQRRHADQLGLPLRSRRRAEPRGRRTRSSTTCSMPQPGAEDHGRTSSTRRQTRPLRDLMPDSYKNNPVIFPPAKS